MTEIITGRSGSGKTELLYKYISELDENKKAVLIVPEQSSFYNEKRIIRTLGDRRAKNIEVLTFRRLSSNIAEMYKGITGKRIDDGIKAVLMSMAIDNAPSEGGELELYGKKGRKSLKKTMDLVDPMLTAVNEYKMCMISPQDVFDAAGRVESRILSSKLRDSARIYAAYNALLENTYEDPDDDLTRLYDILGEYEYFKGMNVFVDSFYGFSAQEMKILERIFAQADRVCITVCCDKMIAGRKTTIFEEPARTYRELIRKAQEFSDKCILTDIKENGRRFHTDALRAVEEWLFFGYRSGEKPEQINNDGSIHMFEAADVYDEIDHAAKEIFRLVHNEGYRYNEIEVIARNLESYKSVIRSEFPKYNIPYFLSDSECLDKKSFVCMVLAAFDAVHGYYDTESILRLAKSGFLPISEPESFELENYVYIWSIRGKRWLEPFTMSAEGIAQTGTENDTAKKITESIEETRQKIIAPLVKFAETLHKAENGADISYALFRLIEEYGCKTQFRSYIENVRKQRDDMQAEREAGVWDKFMAILDKMYDIMKERRTDSRTYLELLKVYLKKTPVSEIPETLNSVTIGTAGTIRSESPRVVFAVGCCEGVFPAQPSAVGIFTDSERRLLREECPEEYRLPLYDSIFGNSLKEKFNVYTTLTAPSEKLFVSWYLQDLSGKAAQPSVIKSEILSVLPDTQTERKRSETEENTEELLFTKRQGFDVCSKLWQSSTEMSAALREYYENSDEYGDRTRAMIRSEEKQAFSLKDADRIRKLFGSPMRLSSSKLEMFTNCKFAYFCRYGLEAYPIKKAAMDGGLYGSAMHHIFERMLKERTIEEFMALSPDKLKAAIKKYLNEFVAELGDDKEMGSRFFALCTRIRRNAFKTLVRMQKQFMKDSFRPVDYELRIGADEGDGIPAYEIELPEGNKLIVTGFVDRVDTVEHNGSQYIRIIDYKTGKDDLKIGYVANGMKIQMLLYLSAILKNGKERYNGGKIMLPAGVLYVPATSRSDVAVSGSRLSDSEKAEIKNFRMKGLLLEDKDILSLMENDLSGEFIPASVTKKNELSSKSSVISKEEFDLVFRYVDLCLRSMGEELYAGNIEAYPEKNACQYCEYKSVCRFEEGDKYREPIKFDRKSAVEYMAGKEMSDGGEE